MMTRSFDACFLGIDIGGTTIKAGRFSMDGKLLEKTEFPTDKSDNGSHIISDIANFVSKQKNVKGIGLGVPGSVTDDGTVNKCVNLGWGVCNPKEMLQELTGVPVFVGNDANMAALGEYSMAREASKKQYSSILFLTLGTGVGGGIIIDGKPVNGANGAAAEIGHLPVVWDETTYCNCGKKGCLEQVASATGVVRTAKKFLETQGSSTLSKYDNLTAKAVFDEAKAGDKVASMSVEHVTHFLGLGIACAAGVIDPECIIIGGGMSAAGEFLIERIKKSYQKNVFHPSRETEITLAKLGNDAGMYGAAYLVMNQLK